MHGVRLRAAIECLLESMVRKTRRLTQTRCEFCTRGNTNTCANLRYCGLDPTDGTLCQYFTCRAAMTVPLPDSVSWLEAAAIQPLAIAVQLGRRAELNAHKSLAILCVPDLPSTPVST